MPWPSPRSFAGKAALKATLPPAANLSEVRFGPIPDGLRDSLEAVADPEKLRVLHRAAIVTDSLESFAGSL
jgi:hypothetical protein